MRGITHGVLGGLALVLLAAAVPATGAPTPRGILGVTEGRLARLDPVTLRPLVRGPRMGVPRAWAARPGGSAHALAQGREIRLVDSRRLRIVRRITAAAPVSALAWPTPQRLVAVSPGRIVTYDGRGRTVGAVRIAATARATAARGGTVVVAAGDELWVSRAGARFQAARAGIGRIERFALSGDGRSAVAIAGSRAVHLDTATGALESGVLRVRGAVVAAALSGAQLVVATEDRGEEGVRPGGAYVVDLQTWRVRVLDAEARGIAAAGRRVVAFAHVSEPSPRDPELVRVVGIGVRGYDAAGRRSFHVLGRVAVAGVTIHGRYAYVQVWARAWLAVVDLERARIASRTVGARTTLLVGQGS